MQGIACDLESEGYKYLDAATAEVLGKSEPYSDCGSLPLVGDMQEAGFDIQVNEEIVYFSTNCVCLVIDYIHAGLWIWPHSCLPL